MVDKIFIILLVVSILAIGVVLLSMKSKENYQTQRNMYSFMYTKDDNGTYTRYNGEVPRFAYSDFFG
jgi:cell division protein FtsL